MDAMNEKLSAISSITDVLSNALEEELALPPSPAEGAAPAADLPPARDDLVAEIEEHCRSIAQNKAALSAIRESTARKVAELDDERRREIDARNNRVAQLDADIRAVRTAAQKQSDKVERRIAASGSALKELLA